MMKIKKKVKMNLHELIKWCWDNDVKSKSFFNAQDSHQFVSFDKDGSLVCNNTFRRVFLKSEKYIAEVEEEITEDTLISDLLEVYDFDGDLKSEHWSVRTIKEILVESNDEDIISKAFHIINDDGTLTLIWKDGEMVE
ncbi:hypothetical protein BSR39_05725 [Staphylococcus pseudintermedius]|nr:hypothetical protein BSR39_05725 [Staphylococcus pseudintermedius]